MAQIEENVVSYKTKTNNNPALNSPNIKEDNKIPKISSEHITEKPFKLSKLNSLRKVVEESQETKIEITNNIFSPSIDQKMKHYDNSNNRNSGRMSFISQSDCDIPSSYTVTPTKLISKQSQMSVKPVTLDNSKAIMTGKLKFFEEKKNYGFIVMDVDNSDVFVHYEELNKAGLNKEQLRNTKRVKNLRLRFCLLTYIGKHSKSRKAVNIILMEDTKVD